MGKHTIWKKYSEGRKDIAKGGENKKRWYISKARERQYTYEVVHMFVALCAIGCAFECGTRGADRTACAVYFPRHARRCESLSEFNPARCSASGATFETSLPTRLNPRADLNLSELMLIRSRRASARRNARPEKSTRSGLGARPHEISISKQTISPHLTLSHPPMIYRFWFLLGVRSRARALARYILMLNDAKCRCE